jgi:tetratricopeptide (TPR) repeat protein
VLAAEAGMGKSRLVEALFERIGEEPHRRIVAQCSPYRGNSAFFPLLRQFEQAAGFAPADPPVQKLDKLEAVIAKAGVATFPMAPLLADLLSSPTDGRYPPIDLAPAQRKDATIAALVDYFMRLSEREPVVFVLEDAHWIDPTTLGFLTRLIDTIASGRVLAIITARPDFLSPWIGRGHVGSLTLSRLGKAQCAEIVAGVITERLVTPDVLEEILAKTDGVPLFVEELTRAIAEADTTGRLVVPATLQDALMARLDRLGPAKEIAQLAATIGRQFSFALLAALTPISADDLERTLVKLSEAGLVFPQARAIERSFGFKHALMRDVAYDSLLRARRQKLHERIALTLEERFPRMAEAEPEILAHHFSQAGLAARACLYCERAGERAVARFAYAEAVAHFSAGLAQADAMPFGPERSRRELALLLKLGPAIVILKGTRDPQVEQVYQRACEIAETLDDQQALFRARWGLWFVANLNRDTRLAHERAERLVLIGQQSEDDELFLQAIHSRWSTAFFRGDVSKALADAQEGARHYDIERHSRLGAEFGGHDPGVCAQTVSAMALAQSGKARAAAASAERGIALAETLNDPSSLAFAFMNSMAAYQIVGDRDAVLRLTARMIEIADRFKLPPQRSIATFMSAWANARGDGLVSGLATMESEFARVQIMGPLPQLYAGLLGEIRLEGGHTAQALELLDAALKIVKEPGVGFYLPEIQRLRGECLLRLDPPDFDGAMREFETAVATAVGQQARVFQLRARISLARAWIATGSPESGLAPLRDLVDVLGGDDDAPEIAVARHILAAHPV